MVKSTTTEDYVQRIQRVLNYLSTTLDGPLDLHRLAQEACLSPFHFHRIYAAITGETIADTVRRLRLQRAAVDLLSGQRAMLRIARLAGYTSVQAFGRAFRVAYGVPPAAYRKQGGLSAPVSDPLTVPSGDPDRYQVTVEMVAPVAVMALRNIGSHDGLPYRFEHLVNWASTHRQLGPQSRVFSVFHDDPTVTPLAELRADACISTQGDVPIEPPFHATATPSGRCAVVVCRGPFHESEGVLNWLCGYWLPAHKETPNDLPAFMEHVGNPRTTPAAELITRIYLPLT